jgi:histidinol-phosphate aminotransferase
MRAKPGQERHRPENPTGLGRRQCAAAGSTRGDDPLTLPPVRGASTLLPAPLQDADGTWRLAYNELPFSPPASVRERIVAAISSLPLYPWTAQGEAEAALAAHLGVAADQVLLLAGIDSALDLLLGRAGRGACFLPGFPGHWERGDELELRFDRLPLDDDWYPARSPEELAGVGLLVVSRPGNPVGRYRPGWIERALDTVKFVLVDETYVDFSGLRSLIPEVERRPNLVVFRSLSKFYGLAGLRGGFLVGGAELLAELRPRQRALETGSVIPAAVLGFLEDDSGFLERAAAFVHRERPRYAALLRRHTRLFDHVEESDANWVLARCRAEVPPEQPADGLRRRGVLICECGPYGLPGWIRVSIGPPAAFHALEHALEGAAETLAGPVPAGWTLDAQG